MKKPSVLSPIVFSVLALPALANGPFYGDPPDATHPWGIHDMNRPQPVRVEPGTFSSQDLPGQPPSDAIVLFGGKESDLEKWCEDKIEKGPAKWAVKDGVLHVVPGGGYIRTREEFDECQLHVEWSVPADIQGKGQGRGNSGVFLMGLVEVQVLDIYNNPSYPDGMASAIYGINPPMANAVRPSGQWQTYDIVFRKPVFRNGVEVDPGYVTVFVNGVLTQDHTPLEGKGGHRVRSKPMEFPEKGPIKLQDHNDPVRYRNIWLRPLPKRVVAGGEGSHMSEEATKARRAEAAREIRANAATLQGTARAVRLLESLSYEANEGAQTEAFKLATAFVNEVKTLAPEKLEDKKDEVLDYQQALAYLEKYKILQENALLSDLNALVKARNWKVKK